MNKIKDIDANLCSAYLNGTATREEEKLVLKEIIRSSSLAMTLNLAAAAAKATATAKAAAAAKAAATSKAASAAGAAASRGMKAKKIF